MSGQRTSPASFSRLKDLLPASGESAAASSSVTANAPSARGISDVQHLDVHQSAPARSALAARPGRRLQHTKPATFRLAIELTEVLKEVAQHNNLNMTDIVAEAIWLHLANFEWPNGLDAKRDLLNAHFNLPGKA